VLSRKYYYLIDISQECLFYPFVWIWLDRKRLREGKKNIDNIYLLLAFINQKEKEKGVKIT
jgi:hypothetical protein